ncbi:MAG: hypothetical protein KF693_01955 [Nitrospira sp.]|nr:hypothetical protein [Nitrospira sp.]
MKWPRWVGSPLRAVHVGFGVVLFGLGIWSACSSNNTDVFPPAPATDYEVWVSDQAHTQGITAGTPTGTHGGHILVYDGVDLEKTPPVDNPRIVDATADLFPTADVTTGGHVSRIHGILPSPDHVYMALNFVASGHLGIVHGQTKAPVCLFRTTETSTGRQNHMSFWTPDGRYLIVANQNGRIAERVDIVRNAQGQVVGFVFNAAASLDLVGGAGRILTQPVAVDVNPADEISCTVSGTVPDNQPTTTPTGALKQAAGIRPTNNLICPIAASNNRHAFATLGGGGMFVLDVTATPIAIVAEYDLSVVRAAGCGGVQSSEYIHLNTGTSAMGVSEFSIYRFTLNYPQAPAFNPPNQPPPVTVWEDPDNGKVAGVDLPAGTNRDAHAMVVVRNRLPGTARYLHQFDRVRNNVEVFRLAPPWNTLDGQYEGSYDLTTTGVCGQTLGAPMSNDPTPDLGEVSFGGNPQGDRIYVALRGPFPVTVAHAADGSCPGLGIITLSADRRSGELTTVFDTTVLNNGGTENRSDPHAAIVRAKTS